MWIFLTRAWYALWSFSNEDSTVWSWHPLETEMILPGLLQSSSRWEKKEKKRHFFVALAWKGYISHLAPILWVRIGPMVCLDAKGAGKCGPGWEQLCSNSFTQWKGSTHCGGHLAYLPHQSGIPISMPIGFREGGPIVFIFNFFIVKSMSESGMLDASCVPSHVF